MADLMSMLRRSARPLCTQAARQVRGGGGPALQGGHHGACSFAVASTTTPLARFSSSAPGCPPSRAVSGFAAMRLHGLLCRSTPQSAILGRSREFCFERRPSYIGRLASCRSFATSSGWRPPTSTPLYAASGRGGWREHERQFNSGRTSWWVAALMVGCFAFTFALVPLYKVYCQQTGQGQAVTGHKEYSAPPTPGSAAAERLIRVDFNSQVHMALPWEFTPQQRNMTVGLGETALAFYRAKNTSDRPIIGVSVYHMDPPETGLYFNKIQCFCFDEQLINPNEEVDLPIFFYIDPLMQDDSRFDHCNRITLNYLFFESDSDIPEEYQHYVSAKRPSSEPPALQAPAPTASKPVSAAAV
eukprot:TRINITY_DN74694_c0_g1_i1.p1 TRINITY_DN74694_c0_g1~~TRINITY_DN74694_c0_g1_i1.p1  ORF type:complete len:374 (-),score=41.58 TRINITY_DN74694_c0_g1_i1:314-1387(-)